MENKFEEEGREQMRNQAEDEKLWDVIGGHSYTLNILSKLNSFGTY